MGPRLRRRSPRTQPRRDRRARVAASGRPGRARRGRLRQRSARRWAASATPPASPDRPPARAGISLGDALAALFAVIGTLAALSTRASSGQGPGGRRRHLRGGRRADGVDDGRLRARRRRAHPHRAACCRASRRRTSYPTADGADVLDRRQRRRGVRAGCARRWAGPSSPTDARFATHARAGREHGRARRARSRRGPRRSPCDELLATLDEHGVPAGRIFTAPDMLTDPHYLAREMVLRRTSTPGLGRPDDRHRAALLRARPGASVTSGPTLGEHTDEVLARAARARATPRSQSLRCGTEPVG